MKFVNSISAKNLKKEALSGGRWLTAVTSIRVLLQFIQMMILARLLVPADFGLIALVAGFVAVVTTFVDVGLNSALIHYPKPSLSILSSLYWTNLACSFLIMVLFAAAAWPISFLYKEPILFPLLLISSLIFPVGAIGLQFKVLAEKELCFAAIARIEVCGVVLGFCVAIILALNGVGVYSLVFSALSSVAVTSLLFVRFLSHTYRPSWCFQLVEIDRYLRYGAFRIGEALAGVLRMQADILIGSFIFGPAVMGVYTLPRDLSLRIANSVVNPVVTRIGFPIMAKLQHDKEAMKAVYLRTLRMTASINFPIYALLAIFAEDVVALMLGAQWEGAGYFLALFALWGLVRSIGNPVGSLLYAAGEVRRAFLWNLILLVLIPIVLWGSAVSNGMKGLAFSMLVLQGVVFFPAWRFLVFPVCGARLNEYLAQLMPAAIAVVVSGGLSWVLVVVQMQSLNSFVQLFLGGLLFLVSYLFLSFWINRSWVSMMAELLFMSSQEKSAKG